MEKREIKFRAWDQQIDKMVYDFKNTDRTAELNEHGFLLSSCWHILMMSTGLLDKNKNEIYEGDELSIWLEADGGDFSVNAVVFWDTESASFMLKVTYPNEKECIESFADNSEMEFIEVIGNIFENQKEV